MIKEFLVLSDKEQQENILNFYRKEKTKIFFSFLAYNNYRKYTKTIDTVAEYFGEKFGFYFAWLLHYTSFLIISSVIGASFWFIQISNFLQKEPFDTPNYADATDSVWNCLYSMCIALWAVFFVESWKQKEAWYANRWLVMDFNQQSFDREGFKATLSFDSEVRDA